MLSFVTRSTASAVRAIFGQPLQVLHFVADPRTVVRLGLRINFMELNFQFLFSKFENNVFVSKYN